MREALIAVVATGLFFSRAEAAFPSPGALARLVAGQIDFEGLDLNNDEAAKKKPKKKGKKEKQPKKQAPHSGEPSGASAAPTTRTPGPAAPAFTPTESAPPAVPPPPPAPVSGGVITEPALDLTKPADVQKKDKPAPKMTFDAVDVSGKSAERQRLEAAIKLFKDESYEGAALALTEVLRDPKMAGLHEEAEYVLAKTLYRQKMYHSSLIHFRTLLAKGPSGKYFKSGLEWLFFIAHKTVNEQIVLDEVAKWANQEFPDRFRAEFRYLLSRYYFARARALEDAGQAEESKKNFGEARKLLAAVPRGDPFYAKAKYLEGTILFKESDFTSSLEAFKEVVRSNNPRVNADADFHLRELAFMQLARTHYGHQQNRYAIYYYDKVQPGSDQWLEALFESSWAHFRDGNYERALGNLITLSSPFFKDEYFPEALILKAVIYFENCRYREARAILDEFEKTYMPVHNELEKITSQNTDAQRYYDILADIQKRNQAGGKGSTVLLERILKLALTDKDLKLVNDSIIEVEREMDSFADRPDLFRYSDLAKSLNEGLKTERAALMTKAGFLAKAKLELELVQLKELLDNALRIKFETTDKEKEFLERSLVEGKGRTDEIRTYNYSVAVGDERVYWPYEGEYWRDELGTYEYTLTKGCKAR